jgi:MFS family permease
MQWPSFFNGRLQTNVEAGRWVPIPRINGFIWLFIAGVPWAGIGACLLAWCGSRRPTRAWQWALRLGCGFGVSCLAVIWFNHCPGTFLPLYKSIKAQYLDFVSNPNLRRLTNDNREAIRHLGLYLGFVLFEIGRKDWKNVKLILTVGLVNGLGWSLLQNWQWAAPAWPDAHFNFWRCWESSGGISMGIAYGLAYYLVNRRMPLEEGALQGRGLANGQLNLEWLAVYLGLLSAAGFLFIEVLHGWWGALYFGLAGAFGVGYYLLRRMLLGKGLAELASPQEDPNLERLGVYLGLLLGLGMSIRNGLKGWFNLYKGNEAYWDNILWNMAAPLMLVCLLAILARILLRPVPRDFQGDTFPHAYWLIGLVLIVQNVIAQMVTGPYSSWQEVAFSIYYLLLFFITATILYHYHYVKVHEAVPEAAGGQGQQPPAVSGCQS